MFRISYKYRVDRDYGAGDNQDRVRDSLGIVQRLLNIVKPVSILHGQSLLIIEVAGKGSNDPHKVHCLRGRVYYDAHFPHHDDPIMIEPCLLLGKGACHRTLPVSDTKNPSLQR